MLFQHGVLYDAPPAAVFAMLGDPDFRRSACAAQGALSCTVTRTERGAGWAMVVDQLQPTGDLPAFARKIAGAQSRAVQSEDWTDSTGGSFVIESPGKPTGVTGTVTLRPEGAGTREIWELDVRVMVPLVGGKLEKLLVVKITAAIEAEHAVGVSYLKGN